MFTTCFHLPQVAKQEGDAGLKSIVIYKTAPSLWCASAGIVSHENQYPPASGRHEDYISTGPMCRYAEDLLPMLKIMAGPNANQ